MRLDKLLSTVGYGSRKEVKGLLKTGAVKVDGTAVKDAKVHVNPDEQEITVHGEAVSYREFVYFMLHKPQGVISATEDSLHETVLDLLELDDSVYDPFPVGRLDKDTEGLLLLTNDGQLAHQLLSPKKHVPKTYFAKINAPVTEEDAEAFRQGVTLDDGYVTKSAELKILTSGVESEIELTIVEGKFHQVKRMFEARGKKVTYLKRLSMGALLLDESLDLGEYRELTEEELALLQKSNA
ncbi:pseudouridine synthase [Priestia megaterium]|uniref:pseudouridine synthase n=1 Tax=Priestia TaxID=2800373 RepID=UPI00094D116F|nr:MULTISPECIES: pseudouridine synthase [Priestia]MBY0092993.1 rRNA pseudouridine synthase [Priestia aryabhattai]MBY0103435.1 rRNA pseudouridine synthase [Priestia aryabhattai]MCM3096879.1 rRNA pseudouridine synthase [Priestia megaterium]MCM3305327.1 rRNA pseudouridine synthase [Priestia megaterium]MED4137735.1 pseudouridine synthase [Priestia megaterium]